MTTCTFTQTTELATTTLDELDELAFTVAERGIAANEVAVARLADLADRLSVGSLLASIAADATQPDVARERAFGRLAVLVAKALGGRASDTAGGQTGRVARAA